MSKISDRDDSLMEQTVNENSAAGVPGASPPNSFASPPPSEAEHRRRIRLLNDNLRRHAVGGTVVVTQGLAALGAETKNAVLRAVATFDAFDPDNDPYEEHDFGALCVDGLSIFFKIDYYDPALEFHSPDPSDPSVTVRVLTVMLADEY
jgi:hypothetical protein